MRSRLAVLIRIDPAARALIEACVDKLCAAGLGDVIDELADRRVFREGLQHETRHGVWLVKLGPMTELLLREFCDVAERPGWSEAMKRKWMAEIARVAGFA